MITVSRFIMLTCSVMIVAFMQPAIAVTELPVPPKFTTTVKAQHNLMNLTTTLDTEFKNTTVKIIPAADYVTVILPSYYVFINPQRINKSFKPNLKKLIAILQIYEPQTVKIIGYTDNEKTLSKSVALSKDWANTIVNYFVKHGIARETMTVLAYGSLHPITNNFTAAGRMQNQRVEILIYPSS